MNLLPDLVRPGFAGLSPWHHWLVLSLFQPRYPLKLSLLSELPSVVLPGPSSCLLLPLWPLIAGAGERNKELNQPMLFQPSQLCLSVWALSAALVNLSVLQQLLFVLPRWLLQKVAIFISFSSWPVFSSLLPGALASVPLWVKVIRRHSLSSLGNFYLLFSLLWEKLGHSFSWRLASFTECL